MEIQRCSCRLLYTSSPRNPLLLFRLPALRLDAIAMRVTQPPDNPIPGFDSSRAPWRLDPVADARALRTPAPETSRLLLAYAWSVCGLYIGLRQMSREPIRPAQITAYGRSREHGNGPMRRTPHADVWNRQEIPTPRKFPSATRKRSRLPHTAILNRRKMPNPRESTPTT